VAGTGGLLPKGGHTSLCRPERRPYINSVCRRIANATLK
jgi:hypothetical protein